MHDTLPKPERPTPGYTQEDWDEVSDTPSMTDVELADLRPAREVPEVYNLLPKRGRPKLADAKVNLTLRIDPAVLEAYRAKGPGWQVKMQEVLASALAVEDAPAIDTGRRPGTRVVVYRKEAGCTVFQAERSGASGQFMAIRGAAAKPRGKSRPKSA